MVCYGIFWSRQLQHMTQLLTLEVSGLGFQICFRTFFVKVFTT